MASRDGDGPCHPSLRPCHVPASTVPFLSEMGTELALNQASDPCLQPAGTCTANLRDLMLQNNSPAHLCWELEANQVGIANESFGTISVSDKDLQIYF